VLGIILFKFFKYHRLGFSIKLVAANELVQKLVKCEKLGGSANSTARFFVFMNFTTPISPYCDYIRSGAVRLAKKVCCPGFTHF
jgi:hypothetical protein